MIYAIRLREHTRIRTLCIQITNNRVGGIIKLYNIRDLINMCTYMCVTEEYNNIISLKAGFRNY